MIDFVFSCLPAEQRGAAMAEGPVQAALWDGGLGRAQTLCVRNQVGAAGRGYLLADVPAFYGEIVGSGSIDGRIAAGDRTSVGLRMEAIRYQQLISAIPSTFTGYGFTTVSGVHQLTDDADLALVGQLVLPTAIGLYGHTWPIAADLGLGARAGSEVYDLHGQLGLAASTAITKGPSQPRVGVPLTLGGTIRPGSAFAAVLDLQAAFGYAAPLDHLAVAPGVRFAAGRSWGMELSGTVPVAGRERALAAVELATAIRL